MDAHPIVRPNDEFNALDTRPASKATCTVVNAQPADFSHYRYEDELVSVKRIADSTFLLPDIQSSSVKDLVASMGVLAPDHRIRMISVTCSAECNLTGNISGRRNFRTWWVSGRARKIQAVTIGWTSLLYCYVPAQG